MLHLCSTYPRPLLFKETSISSNSLTLPVQVSKDWGRPTVIEKMAHENLIFIAPLGTKAKLGEAALALSDRAAMEFAAKFTIQGVSGGSRVRLMTQDNEQWPQGNFHCGLTDYQAFLVASPDKALPVRAPRLEKIFSYAVLSAALAPQH